MKFDAIFYALEVADAGSFSQAARNLYLSQPNLSYAVRQLEKDLDVQLFHRVPGGVVLTEDGQELIDATASSGGNMSRFKASLSCHTGISGAASDRLLTFQPRGPGFFPVCEKTQRRRLPVFLFEL